MNRVMGISKSEKWDALRKISAKYDWVLLSSFEERGGYIGGAGPAVKAHSKSAPAGGFYEKYCRPPLSDKE